MKANKRINPLAPVIKPIKRKEVYSETYNKGTMATNKEQIIDYIKNSSAIFVNRQSKYDDGTQSMTLTIEIRNADLKL